MTTQHDAPTEARTPLSRERVLQAAVDLADRGGIEAISMRKLGQELGVEAMSLYNHVSNKDDLLTGMVDTVMAQIEPPIEQGDWRAKMRARALSARAVLLGHPWAAEVLETRTEMTPTMLSYMDSAVGFFREAGFSLDLTHHAMHTLGSRSFGFTQELFNDSEAPDQPPEVAALMLQQMLAAYPNIAAMVEEISHDDDSALGGGCDDDEEFEFALDLILDGLERMRIREAEAGAAAE